MPIPRDQIIAGAYTGTWNALAIGNIGLGGYKLRFNYSRKDVFFDAVGNVPVDSLFTGFNMFVDFVLMQYNKEAVETMTWPWGVRGTTPAAGYSIWDRARPLVLTACEQDDTVNPKSITFIKTIIAPDYDQIHNYSGTEERMIPMRLIVLPVKYSGTGYATPLRPDGCADIVYFTEVVVV
jgi:hypothetical protein